MIDQRLRSASASYPAMHWRKHKGRTQCQLCPRQCQLKPNRMGYCGVRGTEASDLLSFNYGRALAATMEVVETEAIYHFQPGAKILSLGNIGCMMSCKFCQNWETSQVKHLDLRQLRQYTPEQIVALCLQHDINILSWTYNDPVVWHEFVLNTSQLARKNGIKTLYKSALYIESAPLQELAQCVDIFSVSLKSMSDSFYRKIARARLRPILDRIEQLADLPVHLEISQLLIPGLNDSQEEVHKTSVWVRDHVGRDIPIHFVGFHPAYQYNSVARTQFNTLQAARNIALDAGLRYVYLGNCNEQNVNDTHCHHCGSVLVHRFGLQAKPGAISEQGQCTTCGTLSPIIEPWGGQETAGSVLMQDFACQQTISWGPEQQSAHLLRTDALLNSHAARIRIRDSGNNQCQEIVINPGLERILLFQSHPQQRQVTVSWLPHTQFHVAQVLDRAHFPIVVDDYRHDTPSRVGDGSRAEPVFA